MIFIMNPETIIYSLNVEDIQTVAMEIMGRELTEAEINIIIEPIGDRMAWFDAIEGAICHCFESEVDNHDEIN